MSASCTLGGRSIADSGGASPARYRPSERYKPEPAHAVRVVLRWCPTGNCGARAIAVHADCGETGREAQLFQGRAVVKGFVANAVERGGEDERG